MPSKSDIDSFAPVANKKLRADDTAKPARAQAVSRAATRVFYRRAAGTKQDQWFFKAREGEFGPYDSNLDAIEAMEDYIRFHKQHH